MKQLAERSNFRFAVVVGLVICGLVLAFEVGSTRVLWAAAGHDGMDMGGDGGTTTSTVTGELEFSHAVLPGEPQPSDAFTAVLVVTADDVSVTSLSPTLTYEFVDAALGDVGTAAMVMERLDGVYEASLSLKYAGQYRLTYSFVHNDANITHTVLQEISHPHSAQSGTSGGLPLGLENFNNLTAAINQTLEFEVEADDEADAAGEVTVYIQDQSGLLNAGQSTLTVNADGNYETDGTANLSGDAPKWDITIKTTNYGTKTFTITLP